MKSIIRIFTLMFLIIVSCSEEDDSILRKEPVTQNKDSEANAKHADGAGTGDLNPTTLGSIGTPLTWNGDGRWVGGLYGTPIFFFGPSPTQLQNGIQGIWETTCANYTPGQCYPDGYTVTGNGAGFTVMAPACGKVGSGTISMPELTRDTIRYYPFPQGGGYYEFKYKWTTSTHTITTLSGGNCKLEAFGKIIVNSDCKPVIVSPNSIIANLCGQNILGVE